VDDEQGNYENGFCGIFDWVSFNGGGLRELDGTPVATPIFF
jgi:hypothetical protein